MTDDDTAKKLNWLEQSVLTAFDNAKGTAKSLGVAEDHLRVMLSMLREVCLKLGATPDSFSSHHEALLTRFSDLRLNRVEEDFPRVAGLLDDRTLGEIYTGDLIPPLFPEKQGPPNKAME